MEYDYIWESREVRSKRGQGKVTEPDRETEEKQTPPGSQRQEKTFKVGYSSNETLWGLGQSVLTLNVI